MLGTILFGHLRRERNDHILYSDVRQIFHILTPPKFIHQSSRCSKPLSPLFDSSTVVSLTPVHDDIFIPVKLILVRYVLLLSLPKYSIILLSNICSVSTLLHLQLWWAERLHDQDLNHWPKSRRVERMEPYATPQVISLKDDPSPLFSATHSSNFSLHVACSYSSSLLGQTVLRGLVSLVHPTIISVSGIHSLI